MQLEADNCQEMENLPRTKSRAKFTLHEEPCIQIKLSACLRAMIVRSLAVVLVVAFIGADAALPTPAARSLAARAAVRVDPEV